MSDTDVIQMNEKVDAATNALPATYNVEFFHIYTDEKINGVHKGSLDFLVQKRESWDFAPSTVILIDNYNPINHVLSAEEIFEYLATQDAVPDFWAYEGDLVENAKVLLSQVTSEKLRRSYEKYIEKRGKYPCSLLTASWYLTRLGCLDYDGVIHRLGSETNYTPVAQLINILPADYSSVEKRAFEIIKRSTYASAAESIEDLFYDIPVDKDVKLF